MARAAPVPVILCTDFGPASAYVGQMKLVIERRIAGARVIDLAHDLPPQDVVAAALVLSTAVPRLPVPSVVVVVVDPGVGSCRDILAVRYRDGLTALIPDNGLIDALLASGRPTSIHAVENSRYFEPEISPVFHGRDVFAPVAACLATGLPPSRLGPRRQLTSLQRLPVPIEAVPDHASVIYVDRFGNLVTNLPARALPSSTAAAWIGRRRAPLVHHYAQVDRGRPLALVGSFGRLEVAVREASAARAWRTGVGAPVRLEIPAATTRRSPRPRHPGTRRLTRPSHRRK
jgi:S-adenosyl-L-methionine hydrolase (adenosine-forming)